MTKLRFFPNRMILIIVTAAVFNAALIWPQSPDPAFKFPYHITYKILKNNRLIGRCRLNYVEKSGKGEHQRERSGLKLVGFQGLGLTQAHALTTDVFRDDLSLFNETVNKGKQLISQLKLKEELDFDGEKKRHFEYITTRNFQVKIIPKYLDINFLSSFLMVSKMAALGKTDSLKKFNFIDGRRAKIVTLNHHPIQYQRINGVSAALNVLTLKYVKKELYRFKIRKDKDNHWYPLQVVFSDLEKNSYELIAEPGSIVWEPLIAPVLSGLPAAYFTFMEPLKQTTIQSGKIEKWMDQAVLQGMKMAAPMKQPLAVNKYDHKTFKLATIFFDPHLTNEQKIQRVVNEIMTPNGLEIIVTGFYIRERENSPIKVSPIVIFLYSKEILTKNLEFQPYNFECRSPSTGETSLCPGALFRIGNTIRELIERY